MSSKTDPSGMSPLHIACESGELVSMVLRAACALAAGALACLFALAPSLGHRANSSLHCVAFLVGPPVCTQAVVKHLLDAKASVDSKNGRGKNPAQVAQEAQQKTVVQFLQKYVQAAAVS